MVRNDNYCISFVHFYFFEYKNRVQHLIEHNR